MKQLTHRIGLVDRLVVLFHELLFAYHWKGSVGVRPMRSVLPFALLAVLCASGCADSAEGTSGNAQTASPPAVATMSTPTPVTDKGEVTLAYWNRCIEVNKQFIADKGDVWFKEFRPAAVGGTCREAAKRLRGIDNTGVDPEVIDHVNRVIRGFEQMGAIAETKGKESLWRDATAAVAFVIKVAKPTMQFGVVADGGSLAIGIGASELGGRATSDGQTKTLGIANRLIDSEEQVIRRVRDSYGIELKPW